MMLPFLSSKPASFYGTLRSAVKYLPVYKKAPRLPAILIRSKSTNSKSNLEFNERQLGKGIEWKHIERISSRPGLIHFVPVRERKRDSFSL